MLHLTLSSHRFCSPGACRARSYMPAAGLGSLGTEPVVNFSWQRQTVLQLPTTTTMSYTSHSQAAYYSTGNPAAWRVPRGVPGAGLLAGSVLEYIRHCR
jgi:hypothetical protein